MLLQSSFNRTEFSLARGYRQGAKVPCGRVRGAEVSVSILLLFVVLSPMGLFPYPHLGASYMYYMDTCPVWCQCVVTQRAHTLHSYMFRLLPEPESMDPPGTYP